MSLNINYAKTNKQNLEKKFRELENKILNTSGLVTTTVPTKKIGKVERKIPDINGLVTANVPNTKTGEVEKKYLIMLNMLLHLSLINFWRNIS